MPFFDDSFFHAIQQDPADDALRLVFADLLEEYGGPADVARSEFIRLQVRGPADPDREAELRRDHEREWLGASREYLSGWSFRRGLVEAVELDAGAFVEHAESLFSENPSLEAVRLTGAGPHLADLAACPWLACVQALDLRDGGVTPADLAHLADSRYVCSLRALDLSGNPLGSFAVDHVKRMDAAEDLEEVHLSRCGLGPYHAVRELVDGRPRPWRRLDLSRNGLDPADLTRLAESDLLTRLEALDLSGNALRVGTAAPLLGSPGLAAMADLSLAGTGLGNADLGALTASPHARSVRSLDLRGNDIGGDYNRRSGWWALAGSPLLSRLRRLLLNWGGETANGWTAARFAFARPARRATPQPCGWIAGILRSSKYLMPSALDECDVEELWWLGDTARRSREASDERRRTWEDWKAEFDAAGEEDVGAYY